MAPSLEIEGQNVKDVPRPLSGEEVVISGISGVFPNSDSVLDFMDNLYSKVRRVIYFIYLKLKRMGDSCFVSGY